MKILITDISLRKSFDISNIIRRHIKASDIIYTSGNSRKIFSYTVYGKRNVLLRKNSFELFEKDLKNIINYHVNEEIIYLPIEEDTTILFYKFIEKYKPKRLKFLLPSLENYNIARNKRKLNVFCLTNNIPAPQNFNTECIKGDNKNFKPLICKPIIGSGANGIIYINNINDLSILNDINKDKFVIQELLPNGNNVFGAFYLMKNGKVISSYGHERIRTFPRSGGVTVYSKFQRNTRILNQGAKLLKKLNWSGFAMVEFLWDPHVRKYKAIEINPRLWGSILLSEFSDSHFLINYINMCLGKEIILPKYVNNTYIKWLTLDLQNIFKREKDSVDKKTCYINVTYSNLWFIFWFHFFFFFNIKNFKKLLLKWKKS